MMPRDTFSYADFVMQIPGPEGESLFEKLKSDKTNKRPFEIGKYPELVQQSDISQAYLEIKEQTKNEISPIIKNLKVPLPEDQDEREKEINTIVNSYKGIGDTISANLVEEMQKQRGLAETPTDEEIVLTAIEATRNFMFSILPQNVIDNDPIKYTFLNDLTLWYHQQQADADPGKAFDNFFIARLQKKVNDESSLVSYFKMVEGDYFVNTVKNDKELLNKFNGILKTQKANVNQEQIIQQREQKQLELVNAQEILKESLKNNKNTISQIEVALTEANSRLVEFRLKQQGLKLDDPESEKISKMIVESNKTIEDLNKQLRIIKPEHKVTNLRNDINNLNKQLENLPVLNQFKNAIKAIVTEAFHEPAKQCIMHEMAGSPENNSSRQLRKEARDIGYTDGRIELYGTLGNGIILPVCAAIKNSSAQNMLKLSLTEAWVNTAVKAQKAMANNPYTSLHDDLITRGDDVAEFRKLTSLVKNVMSIQKDYESRVSYSVSTFFKGPRSSPVLSHITDKLCGLIKEYPDMAMNKIEESMKTFLAEEKAKVNPKSDLNKYIDQCIAKLGVTPKEQQKENISIKEQFTRFIRR